MSIWLVGQNHKTAPVELREKLAMSDEKRAILCDLLRRDPHFEEGVVLSTCNRMELYAVGKPAVAGRERLGELLEEVHGIALPEWESTLYYREEDHAIRHLFRVASGLDSMVLGEGQILSQVRDAHGWASEHRLLKEILHRAFEDAVSCGKRVRTDTSISEGSVSVASAAVSLARKIFQKLEKESVLLIGAGDTGARVARHLQLFGVRDLRVTNRTRARAEQLAAELDATLVPWQALDDHLARVSIVITAVTSPEPIISPDRMKQALKKGRHATVFMIDLAVPRNVDPEVGKLGGTFVYDVDDLQGIVLEDEDQRQLEAAKAEEIVDEQVMRFLQWYRAREMAPTLIDLRRRAEQMRALELEAIRNKVDPETLAEIERVTRRLMNKFLHSPTVALKRSAVNGSAERMVREFRNLFALDQEIDS